MKNSYIEETADTASTLKSALCMSKYKEKLIVIKTISQRNLTPDRQNHPFVHACASFA